MNRRIGIEQICAGRCQLVHVARAQLADLISFFPEADHLAATFIVVQCSQEIHLFFFEIFFICIKNCHLIRLLSSG